MYVLTLSKGVCSRIASAVVVVVAVVAWLLWLHCIQKLSSALLFGHIIVLYVIA